MTNCRHGNKAKLPDVIFVLRRKTQASATCIHQVIDYHYFKKENLVYTILLGCVEIKAKPYR